MRLLSALMLSFIRDANALDAREVPLRIGGLTTPRQCNMMEIRTQTAR